MCMTALQLSKVYSELPNSQYRNQTVGNDIGPLKDMMLRSDFRPDGKHNVAVI